MFAITPHLITCGDNPVNLLFILRLFLAQQDSFLFKEKVLKAMPQLSSAKHVKNKLDSFPAIAFELYSSMARALGL